MNTLETLRTTDRQTTFALLKHLSEPKRKSTFYTSPEKIPMVFSLSVTLLHYKLLDIDKSNIKLGFCVNSRQITRQI